MKLSYTLFLIVALSVIASIILGVTPTLASPMEQTSPASFTHSDALIAPDLPAKSVAAASTLLTAPSPRPDYYETSEYFIGSVAVGVVFLESNGTIDISTENWSSTRESQVVNEIRYSGLSWLANYNLDAHVNFVYDIHYKVPTRYEPINRPSYTGTADQQLWISEAMTYLGYPDTSYFTQVRNYVNDLRNTRGTDWAFAMFVVDSYNDGDGMFTDGKFAYAYLGGPFLVMTYDNDNWGIGDMDNVVAHETLHIFYATDEYDAIPEYSGYLNVRDNDGTYCIMNPSASSSPIWTICSATRGQLGWRDTDSDKIQDIVDTYPNTDLTPYMPDPTNKANLTFIGTVTEVPYSNNNPYGTGHDVTINTVKQVEFRVDSLTWQNATAQDGAFDEAEEAFTFTATSLTSGTHKAETRGKNSVNNQETSFAQDNVLVDLTKPTTNLSYSNPYYSNGTTISVSGTTNFTLTSSDTFSGIAATYYRIDSGTWKPYLNPFALPEISDGVHILHFYSTDYAGNTETTSSFYSVFDNTGPITSLSQPTNQTAINSTNLNFSWTGLDLGSGIDHYEIRIDSSAYINIGAHSSHTFSGVNEGNHTFYLKAIDKLGNLRETQISLVVDVSAPTISITYPTADKLTDLSSVTATWNGLDTLSNIDHYEVKLDHEPWTSTNASTYSWSQISDGAHTLTIKALDEAGNSAVASVRFVTDTTAPIFSVTSPEEESEIKSASVAISLSGSDEVSGIDYYEVRLDNNMWVNIGTTSAYKFNDVGEGYHTLGVRAVDKAGNYRETRIGFLINTSLIGGPGWLDDIAVFGLTTIAALMVVTVAVRRRGQKDGQKK